MRKVTYKQSGVDIDAGERAVELMKRTVKSTHGPLVLGGLADFGGMIGLPEGMRRPVLVAGTDSVGTKLKIAFAMGVHNTVGHDCVAMCVDDIACQGATPLLFLDYIGLSTLVPEVVAEIVEGVAEACRLCGCSLLGGETAELPGFYAEGEYDLVGFAVGAVERDNIIDGSQVAAGDALIGLPSSGLHSNGYSLARYVLLDDPTIPLEQQIAELGRTLGEELLEPTRIYAGSLAKLFAAGAAGELPLPHALAHITGGGIPGNLARVVPDGLTARVDMSSFKRPAIFDLVQRLGNVEEAEMRRTFNLGLGMMLVVAPQAQEATAEMLREAGEEPLVIGEVTEGGAGEVAFT